jgi:hypothetical protein
MGKLACGMFAGANVEVLAFDALATSYTNIHFYSKRTDKLYPAQKTVRSTYFAALPSFHNTRN